MFDTTHCRRSHSVASTRPVGGRKNRVSRLSLVSACSLLCMTGSALAQGDGIKIYEEWIKGLETIGFEVENGPLQYDDSNDRLTVPNFSARLAGEFTVNKDEKSDDATAGDDDDKDAKKAETGNKFTYDTVITSSEVIFEGLTTNGDTIDIKRFVFSDDSKFDVDFSVEGEGKGRFTSTLVGAVTENAHFVIPKPVAEDEKHQASRWLPLMRDLVKNSYDLSKIDKMTMDFEFPIGSGSGDEAATGSVEVINMRVSDLHDGVIGEYSTDSVKQTIKFSDGGPDGPFTQETSVGKTVYKGYDIGALVRFFDPQSPVPSEPDVVLESAVAENYTVKDALTSFKINEMTFGKMTALKPDVDILGFADRALAGEKVDEKQLFLMVFDVYRAFGIESMKVSGMNFSVPEEFTDPTSGKIAITLDEIRLKELSANGLGEFAVEGLDVPTVTGGGSAKLGKFSIGNIEFAPFDAMKPYILGQVDPEQDPIATARAFAPRSLSYLIEGFEAVVPGQGQMKIGLLDQSFLSKVPPIPTEISLEAKDIKIPVEALDDSEAEAFFAQMGLKSLNLSESLKLFWDEQTQELVLDNLVVDVQKLGRVEANFRLSGVPKAVFEDPERQAPLALATMAFNSAEITFKDAGVVNAAIAKGAKDAGVAEADFIKLMIAQVSAQLTALGNQDFANMVTGAAETFLINPENLTVSLKPENAIPVAQILGSAATPQIIPTLLNAKVVANQ
ncbi:MAG: hypothetical protein ABJN26_20455 [Stappiaceae bacterium]